MTDRTSHTGPAALRTTAELLEAAGEFGHNLAVPGLGHSGLWGDCPQTLCRDVRDRLAAAPDPAPVEGGLRALIAAVEKACPVCHGDGWVVEAVPLPSGEPGDPYQAPCWDAEHAVILNGLGTALAARPAPYDDDEFLDDGRLVIPSPEFVQRDPMRRPTARPTPSGDARVIAAANAILDRPYADPDDDAAVCARAALRAAAPSDGAEPSDVPGGRSARYWTERYRPALVNDPTYHSTVTAKEADEAEHALRPFEEAAAAAPSDGAGGLDVAWATHEPHCNERCIHYLEGDGTVREAFGFPRVLRREPGGINPRQGVVTDPSPTEASDDRTDPTS